jgi:EAL domain-containing protein (putative c-di-GMP-specific phosphodiesterase class I)
VVDDEDVLRRALVRSLSRKRFDAVAASDGLEVVRLLETESFDAVITDVLMPGLTGVELLRAVREHDLDLPVLLMSGAPTVQAAIDGVRHGAVEYILKPFQLEELESKIRRAVALYRLAKERRRALRLFEAGRPEPGDLAGLEVMFDRALDTTWLAYQPIVHATRRELFAYEALLRCDEPAFPHPAAVLDAAERLDRLGEIGRAVRNKAAEPMAAVPPAILLFVNVHAKDLGDEMITDPSTPLGLIASRVVLEVTERAFLNQVKDVRGAVAELRAMGFRIAVDDLGAGFAGLTNFAQLEPEFVKLDATLIRDLHKNATKQKLVESMTTLCKEMGIAVIAEGIETRDERNAAVELGCDLLQGFLFARPGKPFPRVVW